MNERTMGPVQTKLRAALELLKRGTCAGAYARDDYGNPVSAVSPSACSWCAIGALHRVGMDDDAYLGAFHLLRDAAAKKIGRPNIITASDKYGAIPLYEAAIERAAKEGL